MMSVMWVYMESWIIKDGAAELARGSHLRGVGLRAHCLGVGSARPAADGITELADPRARQEPASHRYELTGMAGPAADVHACEGPARRHVGSEFVITAGDQAFVASAAGPASMVAAGSRVTAQCTLSVVAGGAMTLTRRSWRGTCSIWHRSERGQACEMPEARKIRRAGHSGTGGDQEP